MDYDRTPVSGLAPLYGTFPSDPAITVSRLTKIYRSSRIPANDDISLSVRHAEVFGVFGPNGAGKTTLVRQMVGLLRPTAGNVSLFGEDIVRHPEAAPRLVGYYGQKVLGLRAHRVREVVLLAALLRGLPMSEARARADALLEEFDLAPIGRHLMSKVSGGQCRLAALLSCLVGRTPALVLDEPTNELDPLMRRRVWDHLRRLRAEQGTTIVLVTHNVLEAEQVVDRVAIIDGGRLKALGTPEELRTQVGGTVRVEVRLGDPAAGRRLAEMPGAVAVGDGSWQVRVSKGEAARVLSDVIERTGLEAIDDFRLVAPTLEDVYVRLAGRKWDGERA